jgi:hypothetical protein
MPQATKYLSDKFNEESAWNQIRGKFTCDKGMFTEIKGVALTDDDWDAVDYMIQEWDYGYKPQESA